MSPATYTIAPHVKIAEGLLTINQRNHTRLDRKERPCRKAVRMMKSMTYL